MTLQATIAAILDDPIFGGALYYIQAPDFGIADGQTFGVFTIVGGQSFQTLEGDIPTSQPRVQVSIFATSSPDLVEKVAAVQSAMLAANEAGVLLNYSSSVPTDGFDAETRRFYSHLDFHCWWNPDE